MSVKLIWITPNAENIISFCARVSNPQNQHNYSTSSKLLKYCIKNKHWSVFEMASMCVEIQTTRAISPQILRHRSFNFQEFSQRYSSDISIDIPHFRIQDIKNRQNSLDVIDNDKQQLLQQKANNLFEQSIDLYNELINDGVAKETARMILPLSTKTTIYMSGTIRNWIHYVQVRCDAGTQKEHRDIALQILSILQEHLPSIADLIFNQSNDE